LNSIEIGSMILSVVSPKRISKEGCDEALAGSVEGLPEQFAQLDELLAGRS
jgi:hypothetical protein